MKNWWIGWIILFTLVNMTSSIVQAVDSNVQSDATVSFFGEYSDEPLDPSPLKPESPKPSPTPKPSPVFPQLSETPFTIWPLTIGGICLILANLLLIYQLFGGEGHVY